MKAMSVPLQLPYFRSFPDESYMAQFSALSSHRQTVDHGKNESVGLVGKNRPLSIAFLYVTPDSTIDSGDVPLGP
jgi:hypothetical protein